MCTSSTCRPNGGRIDVQTYMPSDPHWTPLVPCRRRVRLLPLEATGACTGVHLYVGLASRTRTQAQPAANDTVSDVRLDICTHPGEPATRLTWKLVLENVPVITICCVNAHLPSQTSKGARSGIRHVSMLGKTDPVRAGQSDPSIRLADLAFIRRVATTHPSRCSTAKLGMIRVHVYRCTPYWPASHGAKRKAYPHADSRLMCTEGHPYIVPTTY